ncbi:MAG: four helix bundle protein [Ignavibacteria bacterium]|nr:four helix bundle protein [Ignavibacteria bacterium]
MKENVVKDKSFKFAVRIVRLYQYLCEEKREYVLSKQILRSGTSIGANVEEADGGISKADFSNKILLAYKEATETHYWIRLLKETDYMDKKMYNSLIEDSNEICKLLFSILKTSRINKS